MAELPKDYRSFGYDRLFLFKRPRKRETEDCMEKLRCLIVIVCASLLTMSAATASDVQDLEFQGEAEVTVHVIYDPFGPNNLIAAIINFENNNAYDVHVSWQPTITCAGTGSDITKGYGEPFVLSAGGSYQVTIWRSQTCGNRKIEDITVEILEVKKTTAN